MTFLLSMYFYYNYTNYPQVFISLEVDNLYNWGMEKKSSNPKDAVGIAKVPLSTVSAPVMMELGLAMMEGARKYRRHNYRVAGVRASVYYDACMRHLMAWWEGQDIDPDSGLNHVTKAITTLVVLRDAMIFENWNDDRPPAMKNPDWIKDMNELAKGIIDKYPEGLPPYTNEKSN